MLINTHAHFDHVLGNLFVSETYSIPSAIHEDDMLLLSKVSQQTAMFGLEVKQPPMATVFLTEKEPVRFGNSQLQVCTRPDIRSEEFVYILPKINLCLWAILYSTKALVAPICRVEIMTI